MAEVVVSENEIYFGSTRFPVRGRVSRSLASTFPGKVVIGDFNKDTEQLASNLIYSDQRGGLLVEEMDESVHQDRYWWGNCETAFKGHLTLSRLATSITTGFTAMSITNADMETAASGWTNGARGAGGYKGSFQWEVGDGVEAYQDISWDSDYQSDYFLFSGWVYGIDNAGVSEIDGFLKIDDGVGSSTSGQCIARTATGKWQRLSVVRKLDSSATRLRLIMGGDDTDGGIFDEVDCYRIITSAPSDTLNAICEHNSKLYFAFGNILCKLNDTGDAIIPVCECDADITALVSSIGNTLYIYLGDDEAYWYIDDDLILDCDTVWSELVDGDVTATADTSDYVVGSGSLSLEVAAGCAAGDILATEAIDSTDMSDVQDITLHVKSSVALTEGDIQLLLDDTASCASPLKTINFPNVSAATWTEVTLSVGDASGLGAVISVGIKMAVDKGAFTLNIDEVRARSIYVTDGSDSADATHGIHWDSKLFKINSAGQLAYNATPNTVTPTWTANGDLADEGLTSGDVQRLKVYRDAEGTPIIYAVTKRGLFAHDFANGKWLQTELSLPSHPNCGKGVAWWRDALYVSAGLNVHKYIAASTSTISETGLNRDDGLISLYRGEIADLIEGYNDMYALVDSSLLQDGSTEYSGVYAYDGKGWRCIWSSTVANKSMNHGVVSSVYDHRLWFDHNNFLYYIPLQRDTRNPLQVSGTDYILKGVHIMPWFDAGWANLSKVALRFRIYCDGMSENETVVVKYRTDHSYTDYSTGWTTLGTISADGETEYTFASSAGMEFQAIQFRFDLSRSGLDSENTPDILWWSLSYLKVPDPLWGWAVTVDCSQEYKGNTPAQLASAIVTAVETKTLLQFTYRDDSGGSHTHYVKAIGVQSLERTGEDWRGQYQLSLVEF